MVVLAMKHSMLFALLLCGLVIHAQDRKPDRTIYITAERFSFTPSRIKVKQGTVVEFVVTSEDTDHGFRIPSAGIDGVVPQQGKGELRVRFDAAKKGRYPFECSRACGAGHNMMRGEIIVQ